MCAYLEKVFGAVQHLFISFPYSNNCFKHFKCVSPRENIMDEQRDMKYPSSKESAGDEYHCLQGDVS